MSHPYGPQVVGRCPACKVASLFLGDGGYITCGYLPCPDPTAASRLLTEPALSPKQADA